MRPGLHDYAVRGHERPRLRRVVPGRRIAEVDLEMKVWAGRIAGGADNPDGLPSGDGLTDPHGRLPEHVTVPGHDVPGMTDLHVPAAPAEPGVAVAVARQGAAGRRVGVAGHVAQDRHHDPGRRGTDHGAPGCSDVESVSSCLIAVSVWLAM